MAFLALTALGIVFGDIGTSPLYALRFCFHGEHRISPTPFHILGVLSLIVWSLIIVISIKYIMFVMRADNRGEGGILSLMALLAHDKTKAIKRRKWLIWLGLFGAALLYGDGMITPAISVLSAVEGLSVATNVFDPYILPITIVILIVLFLVQSHGSARVGLIFGPVTLLWFLVLGGLGIANILKHPGVLVAVSPHYAVRFFLETGYTGFVVLGAVFLVVTGGEALYADMGHFGPRPIRRVWFSLVLPALILNYFGQGALLTNDPAVAENPFFHMVPRWGLIPLVVLATMATVIASQAVISGVFSLTMQAVQLGYMPRTPIEHTSAHQMGQIYVPVMNWMLMVSTIGLVLAFQGSEQLAAAYGVAVATTIVITTMLLFTTMRRRWGWKLPPTIAIITLFLIVDLAFMGTNLLKFQHGGWFPLLVAAFIFTAMTTWKTGRDILHAKFLSRSAKFETFLNSLQRDMPVRVKGTAVFMTGNVEGVPPGLLHNLRHNKVLHERVVLLTIQTAENPYVERNRITIEKLPLGFYRVIARYGFMEEPDVPELLEQCKPLGLDFRLYDTTFFLGLETIVVSKQPGMAMWRERLFVIMARNAQLATTYFHLPSNRVIVVGVQVEI
jgi:KUP system potassium uptake protein